ncbi:hypothetical protein CGCS363_v007370 [Colletotrichum siamense]|uniref:uncharacterized protein n=1 Tax=Colletotrichum siamense TaxID=690259 RepID=UPI001872A101|nr:uncharacterized protein CGCS363_v007370 [Colletotrichum siamense]KAF5500422.1 hypothetical protein CGCS363_v007370 [Colletotrichum siamense]
MGNYLSSFYRSIWFQPTPHIAVRISASSDRLNMTEGIPLTFFIELTLHHSQPITWESHGWGITHGSTVFRDGGLTFRDTSTGQLVPRGHIDICVESGDNQITEQNKGGWTTLYPGKPHVLEPKLEGTLGPQYWPPPQWTGETEEECRDRPHTVTWQFVRQFKDGKTYEVGISDEARIACYWNGTKEDFLSGRKTQSDATSRSGPIEYKVDETVSFTVSRPDADGSLNYFLG